MTYQLIHGDARHVSTLLEPASVDAIITSPPYFALRSYRDQCSDCDGVGRTERPASRPHRRCQECDLVTDRVRCNGCQGPTKAVPPGPPTGDACPTCHGTGGEHYDGQIGSEPTPAEFLDALIACTRDWLTVLRPGGSIFVNLGDKYSGSNGQSGGTGAASLIHGVGNQANQPTHARRGYVPQSDIPAKSLMGLPWRYAIRCIDELGLILRADIVWAKPNGLPESVTDRVRRSHEQWFHFTTQPRYYAAVDEIRESQASTAPYVGQRFNGANKGGTNGYTTETQSCIPNPLGKLPGSVWTIPSEPLTVPDHLGVDHFAAFPSEWPRRLILGWTPTGWCTACGEPRRAVVEKNAEGRGRSDAGDGGRGIRGLPGYRDVDRTDWSENVTRTITGYACACPTPDAPTRPAVVLDPFAGTGTTVAVAHHLGRHGIGIDLSHDYLRLAEWRCTSDEALRAKVLDRTGIPRPQPPAIPGQTELFGDGAA